MAKKRTQKQKVNAEPDKAKYVASGGSSCPFCGSEELDWTGAITPDCDQDGPYISREVSCKDCSRQWMEIYTLNDIMDYSTRR